MHTYVCDKTLQKDDYKYNAEGVNFCCMELESIQSNSLLLNAKTV